MATNKYTGKPIKESRPGPNGSWILGDVDWESCPCCHGVPGRGRRNCRKCGGTGRVTIRKE